MKFYVTIALFLFALSITPVFAQEQQCSYLAPRETTSFAQNIFSSSIPLCGLPDVTISDSYHFSPERNDIEQRKQELKGLITDAYTTLTKTSDKQEKADLKSVISGWRKEIFALNYKMIVSYKNEYLGKITGK